MNTLRDLVESQYGVMTDAKESTVVVGSTPVKVLDNNPNRVSYLIGNPSTTTVLFARNATLLTSSLGVPVGGGNALADEWKTSMDVVGYELWAISSGGSVTLFVEEVVTASQYQKAQ